MSARRIHSNDDVSGRPAYLDSKRQIVLLKYSQIQIGLLHPLQGQLQSTVPAVTNIISPKLYWHPPLCRPPSTPAHPLTTYDFLSPSLRFPSRPRRPLYFPVLGLVMTTLDGPLCYCPHYSLPLPTPCHFPLNGILCSSLTTGKVDRCRGYRGC